jgi:tetratricopeptide (TPR) repeat protein
MRKEAKKERRRERSYRERRASRDYLKPKPAVKPITELRLFSYEVSFDPIPDTSPESQQLERTVGYDALEELYWQAREEPADAIPRLEKLCKQFPNVPKLYNWLVLSYSLIGNDVKSREINRKLYEEHPDYLFAIVSECHRHIEEGDLDWVAQRLHKKWDVKLLYPYRDIFHFTEVRAFHHMLVHYFVAAKDIPQAEISLKVLEQLDSDDEATADARLRISMAKIRPAFFPRLGSAIRRNIASKVRKLAVPSPVEEDELLPGISRD